MRNIFVTLMIAAVSVSVSQAQPQPKVDPEKVLAAALKNIKAEDINVRIQAAMDLADFGPKAEPALADLLEAMQVKNEDLRLNSSIALAKIGAPAVKPVAKLLNADDLDTRYYAVFTIAALGPDAKETLPTMIKLAGDKNEGIRRKAVYALGRLAGDPEKTIDVLVTAFKDKDEDVRQAAGDALSRFGAKAVPPLIELLKEKDAATRQQAATSLGAIGADAKDAVPRLRELFLAKDSDNPHHYALMLGKLGKEALPALAAGLKDARGQVHQAAAQALMQAGGEAVPILVDGLGEKNVEVRRVSAQMLQQMRIGDKSVVIAFAYALADEDDQFRFTCMQGLQILGPQAKLAGPKLKDALTDMHPQMRTQAFYLLQQIGEDPRPTFKKALESKNDKIRINTASLMAIVNVDVNEAIPILVEALKHDDLPLKMQAASALAQRQLQSDKVMPIFLDGLKHQSSGVRIQAVQGLSQFRNMPDVVCPKLAAAIADSDPGVRQTAVNGLHGVPGKAEIVVPILVKVFKDGDAGVKTTVLQMTWRYGNKTKEILVEASKDKNVAVRQQLVWAMQNIQGDLNEFVPLMLSVCKDKEIQGNVRQQLVWQFHRMGEAGVAPLGELIKNSDSEIRISAMHVLQNLGPKAAVKAMPAVKEAVNDANGNVRLNAIIFVGTHDNDGSAFLAKHFKEDKDGGVRANLLHYLVQPNHRKIGAPLLKTAMKDPAVQVRATAVSLVYQLGQDSKEGLEVFEIGLKDADKNVRVQAGHVGGLFGKKCWGPLEEMLPATKEVDFRQAILQSLAQTGYNSKASVKPLVECLGDANGPVRHFACVILANIGPDAADALPALRKITEDASNQTVQQAARHAIARIETKKK